MLGNLFKLIRPFQWYKNLVVFLALVFSGNIFNIPALTNSIIAFVALCAISSASYILNDIVDKHRDRLNPEKKNRPIASGKISENVALLLVMLLCMTGFGLSLLLPIPFLYTILTFFSLSQIYTVWLKHEAYADVLSISINFVLRAVAGALAINVLVSSWLITGVFFLALYLALSKRRGELNYLKNKNHRPVLEQYTINTATILSIVTIACLIFSYSLYVFFGSNQGLFLTFPLMLYAIFRYESLVSQHHEIARHPHKVFKDKRLLLTIFLWSITVFFSLYYLFPK